MRMSSLFLRTLRDDPADAEVDSHKLLVRAGCIRRVSSGIYSWLPLGERVLRRVGQIVREEMDEAGAQEVTFPILQPIELWEQSGRNAAYGPMMFRVEDRRENWYAMAPTAEEVVTTLVAGEYSSYRDLPVNLYQINWKYRDELRPRFGLLRGREFLMKDAYSFDADLDGLQAQLRGDVRGLRQGLHPLRPHVPGGQGAVGRDRRRHEPGVHGRRRGRRGRVRLVRALRLRRQHRGGHAAGPRRSRRSPTCPRASRCTRPTCPASTSWPTTSARPPTC